MMAQFVVSEPTNGEEIHIRAQKDAGSASKVILLGGLDEIEVLEHEDEDADWAYVKKLPDTGVDQTGWLETKYLGEPLDPIAYPPVAESAFTRACARYELATNSGGAPTPAAYADYLIAWALIVSDLKKFAPQVEGSDANGPFQISSFEWDQFLANQGAASFYTQSHRFRANLQISGAGYLAERDRKAFIDGVTAAGGTASDGDPVPGDELVASFLNLLHCRILGISGAMKVAELYKAGEDALDDLNMEQLLETAVPDAIEREFIAKRFGRFIKESTGPLTVDAFYTKTEGVLNDAFKRAATMFRTHAEDFIPPPPGAGKAPWVAIAEQEVQDHWRAANGDILKENDSAATVDRVVTYFQSTTFHPTTVHHWCGAFVGHCLNMVGGRIADSRIREGARAANWKSWGDRELRIMGPIPIGAIVVLKPGKGTGGSGHVGFFMGFQSHSDKKKINLLGGNQSDTVKISTFKTSQVAAIRWFGDVNETLETGDATAVPGTGPTPIAGATENDVLTLARTLWGESRGESVAGQAGVTGVILNRTRSNRYPDTVAKVCLQPFQFSCWNENDPNRKKMLALQPGGADAKFNDLLELARQAIEGNLPDSTGGALHYHATSVNPSWAKSPPAQLTTNIGNHVFFGNVP